MAMPAWRPALSAMAQLALLLAPSTAMAARPRDLGGVPAKPHLPRASPALGVREIPIRTMAGVSVGLMGAVQFGFGIGVLNTPQDVISSALGIVESPSRWARIVAVFGPAGLLGANSGGALVRGRGARGVLRIIALVFLLGGVLQWAAGGDFVRSGTGYSLLLAGRAVTGFAAGVSTVAVPVYLGEAAPVSLRGAFGNLNQFGVVVGILVAQMLGAGLSTPRGWRWLVGAPAAMAAAQLALAPLLLDSVPRRVAAGEMDRARQLLAAIRPRSTTQAQREAELATMAEDAAEPRRGGSASVSIYAVARRSPPVRRALALGLLLMLAQQLSGINAVFFYSTAIFKAAGLANPLVGTLTTGVVNVLSTAAGVALVERVGRRQLLLTGMAGMAVCALGLSGLLAAGTAAPTSLCLLTVCTSVCFFEIGLGSIPWQIGNELFPPSCRESGMAVCAAANWLATTLVGLAFPVMQRVLGPLCFVPFAACLAVAFGLTYAQLPETKGRTVAQIQRALGETVRHDS